MRVKKPRARAHLPRSDATNAHRVFKPQKVQTVQSCLKGRGVAFYFSRLKNLFNAR